MKRPLRMRVLASIALAGLCCAGGAAAHATEREPVSVELRVLPAEVLVRQQVAVEVRIEHPVWARTSWEAPAFEGFWSERLSSIGEPSVYEGGHPRRVTVFRRALFATRAGALEIPPSRVRWVDQQLEEHLVAVPGGRLRVEALPALGRPADFSGVVGKLSVDAELSSAQVAAGETLHLVVDYHGEANVWDAPAPEVETLLGSGLEVFPERPFMTTGERDGHLTARRSFRFDLVARERGRFEIPPLEVAYFDLAARGYQRARSRPLVLEVVAPGSRTPRRVGDPAVAPAARPELPWPWLLGLIAIVGAGVGLWLARWWRKALGPIFGVSTRSPRACFEQARAALGSQRFPPLLAEALRAGIHARHHLDPSPLTTDELARRIEDPVAIALLERLDRARFRPGSEPSEDLLADVERYLRL